jgi:Helix-turn-helix domain
MNYPAMRAVAEYHQLEGPARAILWAMAYRADRDTAEVWAGQRRLALESGVSRKSVERWLPRLVGQGVLEVVEEGTGPRPDGYRFALEWVEGEAGGSGVVEAQASGTGLVEATTEVIHSPAATGDTESPVTPAHDELVATLLRASGDSQSAEGALVATLSPASGDSSTPLTSTNGEKGFEVKILTSREVHVVRADSTAAAVGADGAYTPPDV